MESKNTILSTVTIIGIVLVMSYEAAASTASVNACKNEKAGLAVCLSKCPKDACIGINCLLVKTSTVDCVLACPVNIKCAGTAAQKNECKKVQIGLEICIGQCIKKNICIGVDCLTTNKNLLVCANKCASTNDGVNCATLG
uniref:TIL domain-containing protein n=1 Tax=Rhabditophanes sp. KR3021 TaxID=114890 RepID=A0AC35TZM1_9BILA